MADEGLSMALHLTPESNIVYAIKEIMHQDPMIIAGSDKALAVVLAPSHCSVDGDESALALGASTDKLL